MAIVEVALAPVWSKGLPTTEDGAPPGVSNSSLNMTPGASRRSDVSDSTTISTSLYLHSWRRLKFDRDLIYQVGSQLSGAPNWRAESLSRIFCTSLMTSFRYLIGHARNKQSTVALLERDSKNSTDATLSRIMPRSHMVFTWNPTPVAKRPRLSTHSQQS